MGNSLKSFQTRKRDRIGWAAVAIALLYIIFAPRSLAQNQRLERLEPTAVASGSLVVASNSGSPYLASGRSFIIRPDQQGVSEVDESGQSRWIREFGTLITSASITGTVSAWGLLDGSIQVLDGKGVLSHELRAGDKGIISGYPCIYSVAISENGESLAAIFGLDPQYFIVFTKNGESYDLVYEKKLMDQVKSAQASSFSLDGSCVIGRTAEGLALYDMTRNRGRILHSRYFTGNMELRIVPVGADSFAILLAKGEERFAGLIRRGALEAMFPVEKGSTGLLVEGNIMAIQGNNAVHRYKVADR
jgi:hypothetical protein